MNQMQLSHMRARQFSLKEIHSESTSMEETNGLDYEVNFTGPQSFEVVFELVLTQMEENFHLEVEYVAEYNTTELIDEEFKNSDFPHLNALAIAFPFLRSFIATVILNAGYSPIFLPPINFAALREQKKNNA